MTGAFGMSVLLVAGAAALVVLGMWGARNAAVLVPPGLSPEDRQHREKVLRRGAWACHVIAALFVVAALGSLL